VILREQFPDQMHTLLTAYDNAIKKGLVTEQRNSGIYQVATEQLKLVADL
jgi:hypothetical protein